MFNVELMLLVATGFVLGLAHALDSDHVIAVSTILCNSPSLRKSIVSATAWGTGHSAALLIVGLLVLAFRVVIPESIMSLLELPAGIALIILGIVSIVCLISSLLNLIALRLKKLHEKIDVVAGLISIGFGVFIIVQVV